MIIRWFINALSLYIVSNIVQGIRLENFSTALVAAVIIGLVNALVKPILSLLTLPITILTLGLFSFLVNAALLMLASKLTPGFIVADFGSALVGSILLSVISTLLYSLVS